MTKKSLKEPPLSIPIPFTHGSNGEYAPRAPSDRDRRAEELYWRLVDEKARRRGMSRRDFMQTACATTTALYVINTAYGCGGTSGMDGGVSSEGGVSAEGGYYDVSEASMEDGDLACDALTGDDFIFDVQTHHVEPTGSWRGSAGWEGFLAVLPQGACGEMDRVDCYDAEHYIREVFINSETAVAVLSAVPAVVGQNPLEIEEAHATRTLVERLSDSERLILHGLVQPDLGAEQLEAMQGLVEDHGIRAWKVYTPFGGWRLDDERVGIPFIERARELGIRNICAHKGLPLAGFDPNFASPDDIGPVARAYPDMNFIVYHSGFDTAVTEGPYDPAGRGVDRLIKSLEDHGIGPNSNVYAELGSTWRNLMTRPDQAAHTLGKLLKHVGQERVLWGTDSIWYGTPQDQISAFRAFEISAELQAMYGYTAMTPEVRARVFGLNAAQVYGVDVSAMRCAIREDELSGARASLDPAQRRSFRQYGPRTRREFFAFLQSRDGRPG